MDWDEIIVSKELHFVYIVNGHKFFTEEEALNYISSKKKKEV
tara:strand:- start:589 stop:714 length:126 start_codon:yes stop_codon:yes gene_type:complete